MNKYTELSDFEINKKVALNIGGFALSLTVIDEPYKSGSNINAFNPCNTPADAMPIIIENCIGILPYKNSSPLAFDLQKGLDRGILVENKNIYRAAMEVFLMMKEAENES